MPSNAEAYEKGYTAFESGQAMADSPYKADMAGHWGIQFRSGFVDASRGKPRRLKKRGPLPFATLLPSEFNQLHTSKKGANK